MTLQELKMQAIGQHADGVHPTVPIKLLLALITVAEAAKAGVREFIEPLTPEEVYLKEALKELQGGE